MIHALFARGHADRAFLAEHAAGVEELASRAAQWSIEAAAARRIEAATSTGSSSSTRAPPAVIRLGWGLERNRNGGSAVAAILALPAVAGKFGVRGGGYTLSNGDARWTVSAETAIGEPPPPTRARST